MGEGCPGTEAWRPPSSRSERKTRSLSHRSGLEAEGQAKTKPETVPSHVEGCESHLLSPSTARDKPGGAHPLPPALVLWEEAPATLPSHRDAAPAWPPGVTSSQVKEKPRSPK